MKKNKFSFSEAHHLQSKGENPNVNWGYQANPIQTKPNQTKTYSPINHPTNQPNSQTNPKQTHIHFLELHSTALGVCTKIQHPALLGYGLNVSDPVSRIMQTDIDINKL